MNYSLFELVKLSFRCFLYNLHILWDLGLRKGEKSSHLILPRDLKSALSFSPNEEDAITQSATCLMLSACFVTFLPSFKDSSAEKSTEKEQCLDFE